MPLPDGTRVNGVPGDKDLQFKAWRGMGIAEAGGLSGKRVLDIGANDGFFALCALMAGAAEVIALDKDWFTWPQNIQYASQAWGVNPKIVTADFFSWEAPHKFDVIFFLGVLYHVQDVFSTMQKLSSLLDHKGALYIETQMSQIESALPLFEYASDIYPTAANQDKTSLGMTGVSSYLFPNTHAMRNLAYSYDFEYEHLNGPNNLYSKENPGRQQFKFSKM
jgi:2-polyprenyl-3-methyl-5-hydroxy-6-metoxy-1,4-benzoquinol methylase